MSLTIALKMTAMKMRSQTQVHQVQQVRPANVVAVAVAAVAVAVVAVVAAASDVAEQKAMTTVKVTRTEESAMQISAAAAVGLGCCWYLWA